MLSEDDVPLQKNISSYMYFEQEWSFWYSFKISSSVLNFLQYFQKILLIFPSHQITIIKLLFNYYIFQ